MKNLLTLLTFALTFTTHIACMNEIQEAQFSIDDPYDLKKMILLDLVKNVHQYVSEEKFQDKPKIISHIIFNISFINKDLYKELKQTRNNPIIARTIINNIAYDSSYRFHSQLTFNSRIINTLTFPGAKQCIALSKQLFNNDLTPEKVEELYQQGAALDYHGTTHNTCPVAYWSSSQFSNERRNNTTTNTTIVKKLLELGVNSDQGDIYYFIMDHKDIELVKTMLQHSAPKYKPWEVTMQRFPESIDLIIAHSTPKDLNNGLQYCLANREGTVEVMQKLIDHGANPNSAFSVITSAFNYPHHSFLFKDTFIEKFLFLCQNKAFDQTILNQFKHLRECMNTLINGLEKNQPL